MPYLLVRKCPVNLPETRLELAPGEHLMGRDADADLFIPDPSISSRHLRIHVEGYRVECTDLDSLNGTYIDGVRLTVPRLLKHGEVIRLGGTELEILVIDPMASLSGISEPGLPLLLNRPARPAETAVEILAETALEHDRADPSLLRAKDPTHREHLSLCLDHVSQAVNDLFSSLAEEELLERSMALLLELLRTDSGTLYLRSPQDPNVVSAVLAYRNGKRLADPAADGAGRALARHVLNTRNAILCRVRPPDMPEDDRPPAVICCPVAAGGGLLGAVRLDPAPAGPAFTSWDLRLAIPLCGFVGLALENQRTMRQIIDQSRLTGHLRRFVPENVIENLMREQAAGFPHLKPRQESITVLQSEIRGFTRLCDSLRPEAVANVLNLYYSVFSDIAPRRQGTLNTFIGDRIVIIFNAPFGLDEPEDAAIHTALEVRRRLQELQPEWERFGLPHFDIGIGISSGQAFVSWIGNDHRMEYTAVGDCVSLASRICWIAGPGQILIQGEIQGRRSLRFSTRQAGTVDLRGQPPELPVYEILN